MSWLIHGSSRIYSYKKEARHKGVTQHTRLLNAPKFMHDQSRAKERAVFQSLSVERSHAKFKSTQFAGFRHASICAWRILQVEAGSLLRTNVPDTHVQIEVPVRSFARNPFR
eukprot:scaffold1823_cov108-Cylindrotheca_fusiformis.AAC.6